MALDPTLPGTVQIPIVRDPNGVAFFELQVTLEGATYTLEFRWNVRAAAWHMSVLDAESSQLLIAGVRLVADYFLCTERVGRTPPGVWMLVDTATAPGMGEDPTFESFGSRHRLYYVPAAALAGG